MEKITGMEAAHEVPPKVLAIYEAVEKLIAVGEDISNVRVSAITELAVTVRLDEDGNVGSMGEHSRRRGLAFHRRIIGQPGAIVLAFVPHLASS